MINTLQYHRSSEKDLRRPGSEIHARIKSLLYLIKIQLLKWWAALNVALISLEIDEGHSRNILS